jgi:hypothetical protein
MLRGRAVTDGILLFVRDQSKRIAFKTRTRRVDAAQPQAVRQPSK